jgi:2-C-methyl-D-erythritol 4-phosphate cytidylyltransferase
VTGGETRTASVVAALAEVPEDAAVVIVHDARPGGARVRADAAGVRRLGPAPGT